MTDEQPVTDVSSDDPVPAEERGHRHNDQDGPVATGCVDIGGGICLRRMLMHGTTDTDGYMFCHDAPDLKWRCEGYVSVNPESPKHWEQTGTLDGGDLTLSPSLLCTRDQFHGFIRDGHWVPA